MNHRLSLNGRAVSTDAPSLSELLRAEGFDLSAAMACAVNRSFVPRSQWASRPLADGDEIDVISPVTGG
ncbi:MAG: sulfur carrier protein ThiS [Rhizobacter sp.]|jgi:sulfur carrier protein